MRRIISVLLENQPGALSRVVGLFSQRGYNIESLTVAPTEDTTLSRLNITVNAEADVHEQIEKQLHKLIDILKVSNITENAHIERELALVKVKAQGEMREEVKRTADIFRGQIVDVTASLYTIQMAGTSEKIDAFISALAEVTKVIEVSRSGVVGLARGEKVMKA
ncbi:MULTISPECIES: acetolactate synthase small subunit [unclassified Shewanella]|uniref:acetolactate synthase small subunit n=1 Tax=unclassified Shewanella TaxID=196818 RepID=UPI000970FE11|nr:MULTISPECIES: acetolactate synthase small subunit [unclassified Shewanella]MDO6618829.1 acetolactate synthase small subunit [Shewanella sp. 6_MG-2023]MDO6640382.1 acetolactate synthase small subunit [Shewanella sp. 5_MG-2023]MDO6677844.1 acetolactate synthase small subunit [Shewanella sp. 4_MG-2023]MDO6775221.1 acetolactate synthase small subunit [Shewanella sp. 3_MG-2023]PMG29691.1 acetolactate synthase small subunit [Shewanella sp. 10N.286.52.C2]